MSVGDFVTFTCISLEREREVLGPSGHFLRESEIKKINDNNKNEKVIIK